MIEKLLILFCRILCSDVSSAIGTDRDDEGLTSNHQDYDSRHQLSLSLLFPHLIHHPSLPLPCHFLSSYFIHHPSFPRPFLFLASFFLLSFFFFSSSFPHPFLILPSSPSLPINRTIIVKTMIQSIRYRARCLGTDDKGGVQQGMCALDYWRGHDVTTNSVANTGAQCVCVRSVC